MKHRITGIFIAATILISLLASGAAYADDGAAPSPGISPDSPWYFFDKIGKGLGMAFAFGSDAKAKKSLQYADERLAEAQKMASVNKTAALEKAIADFEKYIASLQEKLTAIKEQAASDNLSEKAALALIRQIETLNQMKDRVQEKDRVRIEHAANVTMDGQAETLRILSRNRLEKAFEICDNITGRQMEKVRRNTSGNVTSGNITCDLDYAQRISDLEDEMTEKAAASGANVTAIQTRLAQSTANRLEVLSGVYVKVPEKAQAAIAGAIENSVDKYARVVDKLSDKNVVSVNETIKKMPEKLQPTLSNRAEAIKIAPAPDKSKLTTDKSITTANTPGVTVKPTKPSLTASANTTTPKPVTATPTKTTPTPNTSNHR